MRRRIARMVLHDPVIGMSVTLQLGSQSQVPQAEIPDWIVGSGLPVSDMQHAVVTGYAPSL
jgi:hypothetical protein